MTSRAFATLREPLTQAILAERMRTRRCHEGIQINQLLTNKAFEDAIMVLIGKYVLQVEPHFRQHSYRRRYLLDLLAILVGLGRVV